MQWKVKNQLEKKWKKSYCFNKEGNKESTREENVKDPWVVHNVKYFTAVFLKHQCVYESAEYLVNHRFQVSRSAVRPEILHAYRASKIIQLSQVHNYTLSGKTSQKLIEPNINQPLDFLFLLLLFF